MPTARKGTRTGKYRSKFEAKLAPALEAAGARYERLKLHYTLDRVYVPDWETPRGLIIEIKGYLDASDRGKMRAIKLAYPMRDIRFVFQNAQTRLTPKSKTTYAQWAEKHGFQWAHGDVPASWLQ